MRPRSLSDSNPLNVSTIVPAKSALNDASMGRLVRSASAKHLREGQHRLRPTLRVRHQWCKSEFDARHLRYPNYKQRERGRRGKEGDKGGGEEKRPQADKQRKGERTKGERRRREERETGEETSRKQAGEGRGGGEEGGREREGKDEEANASSSNNQASKQASKQVAIDFAARRSQAKHHWQDHVDDTSIAKPCIQARSW